jgi:maleylacetoacetate isomerase
MSDTVKLHSYFRSSAAFRVRIALNLKGVPYEYVPHHLRKNEHRAPEYLALNPQGLVPAIEIDGQVLLQSLAIIEYLDETIPFPRLLPEDPAGRARVRALAQVIACDIHPLDNFRVLRYLRRELKQDEIAIQTWYNHWIAEGFRALEPMLSEEAGTGLFCHGDTPGFADICLFPQVVNSQNYNLDLSPFPTIERLFHEAMRIPVFERAMPKNQPDAESSTG